MNTGVLQTLTLSPREQDVLWLYGYEGKLTKHTADELAITFETARSYIKRIRTKLRLRGVPADSRVDLYRAALDECRDRPEFLAARDELLRYLLSEDAPERVPLPINAKV